MANKIAFLGGDSQVGTTMTAQSVCEVLAKSGKKVFLIMTGYSCGEDYINKPVFSSIDDIRVNLHENQLTKAELDEMVVTCRKVDILPGIRNLLTADYYDNEALLPVIKLCEEDYDYIVIDGGSNILSGLTQSAISCCDSLYIVITQQEKCIRRTDNVKDIISGRIDKPLTYVVNKYNPSPAFYGKKQLETILKSEDILYIDYLPFGWQAETERNTLLKHSKYEKNIKKLVSHLNGDKDDKKNFRRYLLSC